MQDLYYERTYVLHMVYVGTKLMPNEQDMVLYCTVYYCTNGTRRNVCTVTCMNINIACECMWIWTPMYPAFQRGMPVNPGDDLVLAEGEIGIGLVLLDGIVHPVHNNPVRLRQGSVVIHKDVTNLILLQSKVQPAHVQVIDRVCLCNYIEMTSAQCSTIHMPSTSKCQKHKHSHTSLHKHALAPTHPFRSTHPHPHSPL